MKRFLFWAAAAVLAGGLSMTGQTQGQQGPCRGDKDGDGKCDICGRPAGSGRAQGAGRGYGRGPRNGQGPRCWQQNQGGGQQQQQQQQGQRGQRN